MLHAVVMLLLFADPRRTLDAVQREDVRVAKLHAESFCRAAGGCPQPLEVVIEADDAMDDVLAHTTLGSLGYGCTLHFTQYSVRRRDVIAHEACHCALDGDVMGWMGYRYGTPKHVRNARERRAVECGKTIEKGEAWRKETAR